jgi:hypothetical protein
MPRHARRSKHTVYFELRDACTKGGCPICTLVLDAVARYMDGVIYENVNDPPTRDAVVAARGYCNTHSWRLREMGAGFGTALMYRDVLRHLSEEIAGSAGGSGLALFGDGRKGGLLDRLAGLAGSADAGTKGQAAPDPHVACPACQARGRYEALYLGALLDHLGDEELAQACRAAGGLCLVHLDQAIATARDAAALQYLLDLERDCMARLTRELSEFIRKHDYRFRSEGMGAEGNAWIRAIELVAGKPGIR